MTAEVTTNRIWFSHSLGQQRPTMNEPHFCFRRMRRTRCPHMMGPAVISPDARVDPYPWDATQIPTPSLKSRTLAHTTTFTYDNNERDPEDGRRYHHHVRV